MIAAYFNSWRTVVAALTVMLFAFASGCTGVPEKEFKAYTAAFDEAKDATAQLLLDMDAARTLAAPDAAVAAQGASATSFPMEVDLTSNGSVDEDVVAVRRRALDVVSRFNTVLVELASGRKPEEIKSSVDSLLSGIKNIAGLFGKTIPIPGGAGDLVATVIEALDKANNQQQFVAAAKKAEPIITGILDLFRKDAQDVYKIMALDARKRSARERRKVSDLVRQMQGVAALYRIPADSEQTKRLQAIEKSLDSYLKNVGRDVPSVKLQVNTGPSAIDEMAFSQLEQSLAQAKQAADAYAIIAAEQLARYRLAVAYGKLLRQTAQSLRVVSLALDKPADVRAQAMELIGFAFDVKRKWKALEGASRTAVAG